MTQKSENSFIYTVPSVIHYFNASKASGMKIQLCTIEVPQSAPAIINIQSPT